MTEKRTFERVALPEQHFIHVEKACAMDGPAIAEAMGAGFGTVSMFNGKHHIRPLSMPVALYPAMPDAGQMIFHTGFFISAVDARKATDLGAHIVMVGTYPACEVIRTLHTGPYMNLNQTHSALWDYMKAEGIPGGMPVWEEYVDDPGDTPEDKLRTRAQRTVG